MHSDSEDAELRWRDIGAARVLAGATGRHPAGVTGMRSPRGAAYLTRSGAARGRRRQRARWTGPRTSQLGRGEGGARAAREARWAGFGWRKKPYLKKLLTSPPANEDLLDELFRGYTVDGTTAFVPAPTPGDDYGDNEGQDARTEDDEEEEFAQTPTSRSRQRSQRGKRALNSTTSTLTSPVKRSKSPMVKIVKDIASTFKESVAANTKQIQKRANDKAAFSVKRCQELAFECGVEKTVDSVYAMSKMFETEYQRKFFCGQLTPELRLGYFKKWCRDKNLE
ncbi:uncharacterized protein [Miscanthus floridulus]|uniref:uncharacterized protein n=1 Tax=Miscanthus floridulus TaxID=154761 RepID=UPI003459420C